MKKCLKKNGIIAMSVHGKFNVPYFDSILKPAKKIIPDYLPKYPDTVSYTHLTLPTTPYV